MQLKLQKLTNDAPFEHHYLVPLSFNITLLIKCQHIFQTETLGLDLCYESHKTCNYFWHTKLLFINILHMSSDMAKISHVMMCSQFQKLCFRNHASIFNLAPWASLSITNIGVITHIDNESIIQVSNLLYTQVKMETRSRYRWLVKHIPDCEWKSRLQNETRTFERIVGRILL